MDGIAGVVDKIIVSSVPVNAEGEYELVSSARAALESDPSVPSKCIKLIASGGMIKVEGVVGSVDEKIGVTRILSQLPGVSKVINNLSVSPDIPMTDIRNEILAAFRREAASDASQVGIQVDSGRVTLSGRVRSWNQRRIAHIAAAGVSGVTEVCNELTVDVPVGFLT